MRRFHPHSTSVATSQPTNKCTLRRKDIAKLERDAAAAESLVRRKKMAVLPPDPLFRFKADLGHLHTLCFLETAEHIDGRLQNLSVIDEEPANASKVKHLLLAAGESGIVYFFNLENNRLIYKQQMGVSIQAVHSYLNQVIIQEKEGLVTIYERNGDFAVPISPSTTILYQKTATLPCASGFCKSVRQREKLFLPQENATIQAHDLRKHSTLMTLEYKSCEGIVSCMHDNISAANLGQLMCLEVVDSMLFAGFETGDVFLWNLALGELLAHCKFNECIISITYDCNTRRGVVAGAGDALQVFGVDRQTQAVKPYCELALTNDGCQVVSVRKDSKILVAGGFDGRTRIYSWRSLRLLAALTENHACVTDVQFSTEVVPLWGSEVMAVCGADGVITLWNLYK